MSSFSFVKCKDWIFLTKPTWLHKSGFHWNLGKIWAVTGGAHAPPPAPFELAGAGGGNGVDYA